MEITFRRQQRSAVDMAFGHVSIMVELELEIKFLLETCQIRHNELCQVKKCL